MLSSPLTLRLKLMPASPTVTEAVPVPGETTGLGTSLAPLRVVLTVGGPVWMPMVLAVTSELVPEIRHLRNLGRNSALATFRSSTVTATAAALETAPPKAGDRVAEPSIAGKGQEPG